MEEFDISYQINDSASIKEQVEALSGEKIKKCYQCGKCTAGCPVAFSMDNPPRKIFRLLQVGLAKEAMESSSIWTCAACQTCYTRCPRGVNVPSIMQALVITAKSKGIVPEKNIKIFKDTFLFFVKHFGKVHEMGLIAAFNMLSMQPFKDVTLAPKLYLDGKISIIPHRIKNPSEVKKIYERVEAKDKEKGGNA